jgi:hypothetical protein
VLFRGTIVASPCGNHQDIAVYVSWLLLKYCSLDVNQQSIDQCIRFSNVMCRGPIVFNGLRWDVIVGFVDIGGIVDHHCLKLSFYGYDLIAHKER